MAQKPSMINPYIKYTKSSKDIKLWKRIEKRSFYDFGYRAWYIIPEIIDENKFYGERKLKYTYPLETVIKLNDDPMGDEYIQYMEIGVEWSQNLNKTCFLNPELFHDHVTKEIYKISDTISRNSPAVGDWIYFYQHPNDEDSYGFIVQEPWIFEITSVLNDDASNLSHLTKNLNYKIIMKPAKINRFDDIDPESLEDMNIENILTPENEYLENESDNKYVSDNEEIEIYEQQDRIDL